MVLFQSTIQKLIFSAFFLLNISLLSAQQIVFVAAKISDATETLKIDKNVNFPDIKIELGRNIPFEDIKVAMTNQRQQANYILTTNPNDANYSVKVDNCDNFPDLTIQIGANLSFPDYRIELVDWASRADVLIYSEKMTLSDQELIACLLPLIKEKIAQK